MFLNEKDTVLAQCGSGPTYWNTGYDSNGNQVNHCYYCPYECSSEQCLSYNYSTNGGKCPDHTCTPSPCGSDSDDPDPPACVPNVTYGSCSVSCSGNGPGNHSGSIPWSDGCGGSGSEGCNVCCTGTPDTPDLLSPSNNSTVDYLGNFQLEWNDNGSWSYGCDNTNNYQVFIKAGTNCNDGGAYTALGKIGTSTSISYSDILNTGYTLSEGTYCWYVERDNGAESENSSPWRFTIRESNPYNLTDEGDVCGFRTSGIQVNATVNGGSLSVDDDRISNPMTFNLTYEYTELAGNRNPEWLAFAFGAKDQVNGSVNNTQLREGEFAQALDLGGTDKTFAVRINVTTGNLQYLEPANNTSNVNWGNFVDGQIPSTNVQVLGIGQSGPRVTNVSHDQGNNRVTATFTIWFQDGFPEGRHNIYSYLLVSDSNNNLGTFQQGVASTSEGHLFERIPIFANPGNPTPNDYIWTIDLSEPDVFLSSPQDVSIQAASGERLVQYQWTVEDTHPSEIDETTNFSVNSIQGLHPVLSAYDQVDTELTSPRRIVFEQRYPGTQTIPLVTVTEYDASSLGRLPEYPAEDPTALNVEFRGGTEYTNQDVGGAISFNPALGQFGNANNPSNRYTDTLRYYNLTKPGSRSGIRLDLYSEDFACNVGSNFTGRLVPKAWPLILNSTTQISSQTRPALTIPQNLGYGTFDENQDKTNSDSVDFDITVEGEEEILIIGQYGLNLLQKDGTTIEYNGPSILTNDIYMQSDNSTTYPASNQKRSFQNLYTSQYNSDVLSPPGGVANWYIYLKDLVEEEFQGSIVALDGDQTWSGEIDSIGGNNNQKNVIDIQGNVSINSGSTCNSQSIVFVSGNVTIEDNFITGVNNACMFIVNGNVEILSGGTQAEVPIVDLGASPTLMPYDVVQAFFVVDGSFSTFPDFDVDGNGSPDEGLKWEGLLIEGGVVANELNLGRDINDEGNLYQPAEIIRYEPKYQQIFRDELSSNRFSLRER